MEFNLEPDSVHSAYERQLKSHLNCRCNYDNTWKLVIDCTCIWDTVDSNEPEPSDSRTAQHSFTALGSTLRS